MTLMLHVNATEVPYDGLRALETPPATQSHVPIPHFRVVDLVKSTVGMFGHEVVAEHHGVTEDGARYFGLLSLRSTYTGYEDTVGLRNSHDKSFPIGVAFGSRVFVCDNLAFIADHVVKRRHTANLKRDLPGLVAEMIEPLALHREAQAKTFERYKSAMLTDQQADHAIMRLYREGVIGVQRIADVSEQWEHPTHEEWRANCLAFVQSYHLRIGRQDRRKRLGHAQAASDHRWRVRTPQLRRCIWTTSSPASAIADASGLFPALPSSTASRVGISNAPTTTIGAGHSQLRYPSVSRSAALFQGTQESRWLL